MKIEIEQFGPIQQFVYDLDKDFIVTYGNNNIGKSYSMQIVYLLLKNFIKREHFPHQFNSFIFLLLEGLLDNKEFKNKWENEIKFFIESPDKEIDFTAIMEEIFSVSVSIIFHESLKDFIDSCRNTFGNLEYSLKKNPIIHLKWKNFSIDVLLKEEKVIGKLKENLIYFKKISSSSEYSQEENTFVIFIEQEFKLAVISVFEQIRTCMENWINTICSSCNMVYFLPASRSGIYNGMSAFGQIVAELSKNRSKLSKKIELPGLSEPISDYFIFLSNINGKPNEKLKIYYTKIEEKILKGEVSFDENRSTILYHPQNIDCLFTMSEVSSMVSEVIPITAFLKYILNFSENEETEGKYILFIEEPEAHLHPKNQLILMEIFSELIGAGVQLIMSSHSNYVFNQLNNLVLSKKLDYQCYQPIILEEKEGGSVSRTLEIDELGANDENFADVSEQLYDEREKIIQQLNLGEI